MSHEFLNKQRRQFGSVGTPTAIDTTTDVTAGGVVGGVPIDIYRVGVVVTTSYTAPASGALTMTLSLASPVNASPTSFTVLSFGTTTYNVGDVIWVDVKAPVAQTSGDDTLTGGTTPQTSLLDVAPAGPMRVAPGEAYELSVTNAAQAGDGVVIVEYVEHDEAAASLYSTDGGEEVYINP